MRAWNTGKTHCIRGHQFTPENTVTHPQNGKRSCLRCRCTAQRKYRKDKPVQHRTVRRKWTAKNTDAVNAYRRERYRKNAERERALKRAQWNPEKARSAVIRKKYGITSAMFDALRAAQNGACAICEEPFSKRPYIDHDHSTGVVRGLLCRNCNFGIGQFKDDPVRLEAAISYLHKHKEPKLSLISPLSLARNARTERRSTSGKAWDSRPVDAIR